MGFYPFIHSCFYFVSFLTHAILDGRMAQLLRGAGTFQSCTLSPRTSESTSCLKGDAPLHHPCVRRLLKSKSMSVLKRCHQPVSQPTGGGTEILSPCQVPHSFHFPLDTLSRLKYLLKSFFMKMRTFFYNRLDVKDGLRW